MGDFGEIGFTWVNAHHADSEFNLGQNSLKGVLTRPQNLGNVEEVIIRISDDLARFASRRGGSVLGENPD